MAGRSDPGQALTELTRVSSQIEGAVIVGGGGAVLASSFGSDEATERVAAAARELLARGQERAGEARAPLTHLVVETGEGAVFVVRDGEKVAAAVTSSEPTVGLVFYDLKVTLRETEATKPRRRTAKREKAASSKEAEGA